MSDFMRSVLMRRFYLTGLQEVGVYFRRGLEPLLDCYPCGTNTEELKVDSLRTFDNFKFRVQLVTV